MKSFKQFLLNEALNRKAVENEAVIVLRKIIDMVDDGHVDYGDKRIAMNIGKLIHDKKYNNLDLFIVKSQENGLQVGRHSSDERHGIFIMTTTLPQREKIDTFLQEKERTSNFKNVFVKFINDADLSPTEGMDGTDVEQTNKLNTRQEFETLYRNILHKLDDVFSQYLAAKRDIYKRMERASEDTGDKEILKAGALKLRNEMLGKNVEDFKRKAIEVIGQDKYKMLNKEYREKLDSRLNSFYESKIK